MQQHPVPQNISSFEFKLVGFLTIKQFSYLAINGIFGFFIFISPMPFLLRILVILPFVGLGLALAFVPINGLSFDKWLVVFVRSIYAPSRRIWHKQPKEISFLSPWFAGYLKRPVTPKPTNETGDRSKLESYLGDLRKSKKTSKLDYFEERRLSKIDFRGSTVPHIEQINIQEPDEKSSVAGREIGRPDQAEIAALAVDNTKVEGDPPWLNQ